ncbi:hypothetical protein DIDNDMLP_00128 [Klebsiella phage KP13-7]|nr:hypothetical protein DIDNDMLP_00128 [Klebsiella phage KP13-7]
MGRKQSEETKNRISQALKNKSISLPVEEVIEKYKSGISIVKLSQYYKCSKSKISSILNDNNIKSNRILNKNKLCDKHNIEHIQQPNGKWVCSQCNTERVSERRRQLKILAVEYKGGCCEKCGYNKCIAALEFHHLDPSQKDFSISKEGVTRSFDKIKTELDKCIMVCANCHREIHDEERKE